MEWIPIEAEPKPLTFLQKRIIELQRGGMPNSLICQQLHIRSDHLTEEIYEIRKREAIMAGKLTPEQRAAIWQAHKDGISNKDLAEQYGVSNQAIYQLINKMKNAEEDAMQEAAEEQKKRKVAMINPEFEAAVKEMEAQGKTEPAPVPPEKIPDYIWRALDDKLSACNLEIEEREQRIAELQEEIHGLEYDREKIRAWMEARQ